MRGDVQERTGHADRRRSSSTRPWRSWPPAQAAQNPSSATGEVVQATRPSCRAPEVVRPGAEHAGACGLDHAGTQPRRPEGDGVQVRAFNVDRCENVGELFACIRGEHLTSVDDATDNEEGGYASARD